VGLHGVGGKEDRARLPSRRLQQLKGLNDHLMILLRVIFFIDWG